MLKRGELEYHWVIYGKQKRYRISVASIVTIEHSGLPARWAPLRGKLPKPSRRTQRPRPSTHRVQPLRLQAMAEDSYAIVHMATEHVVARDLSPVSARRIIEALLGAELDWSLGDDGRVPSETIKHALRTINHESLRPHRSARSRNRG